MILIKGMEMPKDRSLWLLIKPDGTVFKIKDNDKLGLPKEGTAVFLPEKHGRLGDLDALTQKLDALADTDRGRVVTTTWANAMVEFGEMVYNAPTIIEAEGGGEDG